MRGTSYAVWDNIDKSFLSWSWLTFKRANEEMLGYFNHHNLRILKVRDNRIVHECNRFVDKPTRHTVVNLKFAQSKLY